MTDLPSLFSVSGGLASAPVVPVLTVSGGAKSGYKVEIAAGHFYFQHSPVRNDDGSIKDVAAITAEAHNLWNKIVAMKVADIAPDAFPTVILIIKPE